MALSAVGLAELIRSFPLHLNTVVATNDNSSSSASSSSSALHANNNCKSRALSARQLRYLSVARLILREKELRMVLIDEPPAEELWVEAVSISPSGAEGEKKEEENQEEKTKKQTDSPGVRTPREREERHEGGGRPMASILKNYFKESCVFIVAHHIASLKGCDRVWVIANGKKAGECLPSAVSTEAKFNAFVRQCAQQTK